MFNRLLCAIAASILLCTTSIVTADPITFQFTGTLDSPVNGSNQFTGSFTINPNPTLTSTGFISENGNNVSLSVNLGGQEMNYVNTSQYPNLATLSVYLNPSNYPVNPSGDTIDVSGVPAASEPGYNPGFGISLSIPNDVIFSQLGPNGVANLQNFNLSALNVENASYTNSSGVLDDGTITSIVAVSTPEPSTLAVFAMLGIAAIVHQRRRTSSRDGIAG